jgi:hypothetical protein
MKYKYFLYYLGKIILETSKTNRNKFEKGQTDVFEIKEADVGDLRKIKIGHNGRGAGAGWHLKEVIIDAPKLGKKWRFPCGRWLDKNEDDGKIERELTPMDMSFEEYQPSISFKHSNKTLKLMIYFLYILQWFLTKS